MKAHHAVAVAVVAVAVMTAILVGCSSEGPSMPGIAGPISAVTVHETKGTCAVSEPRVHDVGLPSTARSADLLWYPGLNAKPCRLYRTQLDAAQAARLLTALRAIKVPDGPMSCPADDGSSVLVRFNETGTSPVVVIGLSGCAVYLPENHALLGAWPKMPGSIAP